MTVLKRGLICTGDSVAVELPGRRRPPGTHETMGLFFR